MLNNTNILPMLTKTNSKSTDKLIVLMSGLDNLDWNTVKEFNLTWELIDNAVVPVLKFTRFDKGEHNDNETLH